LPSTTPIEGPSSHTFTEEAARQAAEEIASAGGREVFFIGRRGPDGLVCELEAHAWGTEDETPAPWQHAAPGNVIIHNHPSGHLEPSRADIAISAEAGAIGAGSYIINNDCTRVRVVVRPHDPRKKTLVDPDAVDKFLGPDSTLAGLLGGYEDRPQQREMAAAVTQAFNEDGIAVVEAGTGTGKSLAYLAPAILYALDNGERVAISTNTINLQEQVLHKDLPLVRRALDREFTAELVKGRSNYVCKRKAEAAREELRQPQTLLIEDDLRGEVRELLDWAAGSETGDLGELPVPPRGDAWERVVSEADNCLRVRCRFYESCFFYNSRRRAARANILVVNHSLLLSDLAIRRESGNWSSAAVLPPVRRIVLDEAHHLEETATRHFGSGVTRSGLRRTISRLLRVDSRGRRGILARAANQATGLFARGLIPPGSPILARIEGELMPAAVNLRETADQLFEEFAYSFLAIARLEPPRPGIEHRVRLVPALTRNPSWDSEAAARLEDLTALASEFCESNRSVLEQVVELDEKPLQGMLDVVMEWRAVVERIDAARRTIVAFLREDDERCRWVEAYQDRQGRLQVRLHDAPIDVAPILREALHDRMKTEVMTSATLAVDREFRFLFERTGLGAIASEAVAGTEEGPAPRALKSVLLDSPFDFRSQVYFGVPDDLGDPRDESFEAGFGKFLVQSISISGGRAFVLFTSAGQMRRLHAVCAPAIRAQGIECMVQGQESRDRLLRRFREDETSVLFATSSFWEGVDVRGRALELLVIARLPFSVPTEPIQEAQFERLRAMGREPFDALVVPRAIIRLKQGFGRLIRSRDDRGAVIVADNRVTRMSYGRRFLASLPMMNVRSIPTPEMLDELRGFYSMNR